LAHIVFALFRLGLDTVSLIQTSIFIPYSYARLPVYDGARYNRK
jgi:hypothetical protein